MNGAVSHQSSARLRAGMQSASAKITNANAVVSAPFGVPKSGQTGEKANVNRPSAATCPFLHQQEARPGQRDYAADCSGACIIGRCGISLPRLTSSGATSTRLRPRALAR